MRWMCTQDNWKSERSSIAAYCHHRPSHLFAAAPESVHGGWNLEWMQPVKLLEDYQLFIYVFRFVPVAQFTDDLHDRQSQKQYKVSAYLFIHLPLFVCPPPTPPSSLLSHSGVQLQFLPCLPGAHGVCWGAELPAAASRRRQQLDLARRPRSENSAHADGQTAAAAWHGRDPGIWTRSLSGVERWRGASNFQMCFKWEKLIIKGKWRVWCLQAAQTWVGSVSVSNPSVLIRETGGTLDASATVSAVTGSLIVLSCS